VLFNFRGYSKKSYEVRRRNFLSRVFIAEKEATANKTCLFKTKTEIRSQTHGTFNAAA
jgi:hypothetical protein